MNRILFADDDLPLLLELRRALDGDRERWHVAFAPGPLEALRMMMHDGFDVVVCSQQMSVMNTAEFLRHVRDNYGRMARVVVSSGRRLESGDPSVALAHAVVNKPCTGNELRVHLQRELAITRRAALGLGADARRA